MATKKRNGSGALTAAQSRRSPPARQSNRRRPAPVAFRHRRLRGGTGDRRDPVIAGGSLLRRSGGRLSAEPDGRPEGGRRHRGKLDVRGGTEGVVQGREGDPERDEQGDREDLLVVVA